jgi:NTE family protein
VIASDVTHRRLLILPNDAEHLGVDPDELEIAYAVRMSMSTQIFFAPVVRHNTETKEDHLIVDGGMLSNIPVWLFDCKSREPKMADVRLLPAEPDYRRPRPGRCHRRWRAPGIASSRWIPARARSLSRREWRGRR